MLIDTEYSKNRLLVSYVDKSGQIKFKIYNWEKPMEYVTCKEDDVDKHPTYRSANGDPIRLEEIKGKARPSRYAVYEFLDALPEEEKEEIFEYNLPKIYFIDIETEIVDGFPEAQDILDSKGNILKHGASTRILSISIVFDDKIVLMGLKELSTESQSRIKHNTNKYFSKLGVEYKFVYMRYENEKDMLSHFFNKMVVKMPVLTGWNFLNYDWLYLVNRARKLEIDPSVSSPTNKLSKPWNAKFESPAHRMIFDYMMLYEKIDTSIKVKESSSLDFVSKSLVGVDKIKYTNTIYVLNEEANINGVHLKEGAIIRKSSDAGYYFYRDIEEIHISNEYFKTISNLFKEVNVSSLQTLYENDFETYMYYNAVDSVLVQKIHDIKNYMSIIFAIASLAKIRVVDVISYTNNNLASIAITEGVLRSRFRDDNFILFKEKESEGTLDTVNSNRIKGGYVKEPIVGMNRWVVCYDFASLYPRTQMEFYISPENYVGVKDEKNESYCTNGRLIDTDNHVVCVNGTVFSKKKSATLRMLEEVYADRVTNKKIMMEKKEEWSKIMAEINDLKSQL